MVRKRQQIYIGRVSITRNADCKIVAGSFPRIIKSMEIRFISSLTADDEEVFAPAVLKAASAFLDQLPIAYTLRIETSGAQVFQHTHVKPEHIDIAETI
jgi:hypothetical protein